jgi:hypothetical protein
MHSNNLGRGIATVAVWSSVVVLSYLFNSFGILNGGGAGLMLLGAAVLTRGMWKFE